MARVAEGLLLARLGELRLGVAALEDRRRGEAALEGLHLKRMEKQMEIEI